MEICCIFLFVVIKTSVVCAQILLPKDDILEVQLAKCILNISKKYFENDKPVILERQINRDCPSDSTYFDQNYISLITLLSQELENPIIHFNCYKEHNRVTNSKPNSAILLLPEYVTQVHDFMFLTKGFLYMLSGLFYNSAIRLVIVCKHLTRTKFEQISIAAFILAGAWEYKIADAIVLLPGVEWSTDPAIDIITWLPKSQSSRCLHELNRFKFLDRWLGIEERFKSNGNIFPLKDVTDLGGCELVVELHRDPPFGPYAEGITPLAYRGELGVYGHMLHIVAEFCNISLLYATDNQNATSTIVTPVFLTAGYGAHDSCLFSYPFFRDTITWYVPVVPIPKWQGMIRVFSVKMWILVTVAFILGFLTFLLLAKMKHQGGNDIVLILMNTLCTYLGIGIAAEFRGFTGACFFTLWLFSCIQIYTAFQSVLIVFLIDPGSYPTVSSVEQLDELGYKKISTYDFVGEIETEIEWNSFDKCDILDCWNVYSGNVAILCSRFYYDYYMEFSNSKIARVVDSEKDYLVSSHFKLGCILGRKFDVLNSRLISAGIPNFLLQQSSLLFWLTKTRELDPDTYSISLIHMQGPLYILLFGFLLAVIIFIFEILYRFFHHN
ncbi:Ionotropic receptor 551 [Blattella germanica]|nr:Ionotropic receptor 551 [Blattella germanica]